MVRPAAAWLAFCAAFLWALTALAQPSLGRPVVDEAGVLSREEQETIAARLVAHREATGVQMAVLLVKTTGGEPIEDYALRAAERWAGGSRERDDGVLYVLAIADRRMRLEVGYGLEDRIPDAAAKRMIDDTRPSLRSERYAEAILAVVDGVILRTMSIKPSTPLAKRKPQAFRSGPVSNYALAWSAGTGLGFVLAWMWRARRAATKPAGEDDETPAGLRPLPGRRQLVEVAVAILASAVPAYLIVGFTAFLPGYVVVSTVAILGLVWADSLYRKASASLSGSSPALVAAIGFTSIVVVPWFAGQVENNDVAGVVPALGVHAVLALGVTGLLFFLRALAQSSSSGSFSSGGSSWSSSDSSSFWTSSSSSSSSSSLWSSSSSSSSSSWSSSSSSTDFSSSSWGGGGGSFGGGGASSSW